MMHEEMSTKKTAVNLIKMVPKHGKKKKAICSDPKKLDKYF